MKKSAHILVVDDEKSMRDSMQLLLNDKYHVHLAKSGKEAIAVVKNKPIDLVLLDIRLPEIDGIEVLKIIKNINESIEVIMVTAVVGVKRAVEAIRSGAYDYITKPFDIAALQEQVEKVLEKRNLLLENITLRRIIEADYQFEKIVGKSASIQEIFRTIDDVAGSNATIFITGESGTGKELVARAIHNRSHRNDKLFVPINCAAIPENLLESELFGHERGSFTGALERQIGKFEIAGGGTLFLDEVGGLPLLMQAKLLRAIQEKEIERIGAAQPVAVDVRIISATNSNLKNEIKKGRFREDLYYRLNVVPLHLSPLRERKEDIPLLVDHFLHKYNHEFRKKIKGVKKDALDMLLRYDWPGNVRELENAVERIIVLSRNDFIYAKQLPVEIRGDIVCPGEPSDLPLSEALKKFEREFIQKAFSKTGGKKSKTAKLLGVHRNTLIHMERTLRLNSYKPRNPLYARH